MFKYETCRRCNIKFRFNINEKDNLCGKCSNILNRYLSIKENHCLIEKLLNIILLYNASNCLNAEEKIKELSNSKKTQINIINQDIDEAIKLLQSIKNTLVYENIRKYNKRMKEISNLLSSFHELTYFSNKVKSNLEIISNHIKTKSEGIISCKGNYIIKYFEQASQILKDLYFKHLTILDVINKSDDNVTAYEITSFIKRISLDLFDNKCIEKLKTEPEPEIIEKFNIFDNKINEFNVINNNKLVLNSSNNDFNIDLNIDYTQTECSYVEEKEDESMKEEKELLKVLNEEDIFKVKESINKFRNMGNQIKLNYIDLDNTKLMKGYNYYDKINEDSIIFDNESSFNDKDNTNIIPFNQVDLTMFPMLICISPNENICLLFQISHSSYKWCYVSDNNNSTHIINKLKDTCLIYAFNRIYVFGGLTINNTISDNVFELNIKNLLLKIKLSPLKNKRYGHSAVFINNIILIIGGSDRISPLSVVDTTEIYDFKECHELESRLNTPRMYFSICKSNNKVYIFGGISHNNNILDSIEYIELIDDYVSKSKWKSIHIKLPLPLLKLGCLFKSNEEVFIFGGITSEYSYSSKCFLMNLSISQTMPLPDMIYKRCFNNNSLFKYKQYIYAISGNVNNKCEVYNYKSNEWIEIDSYKKTYNSIENINDYIFCLNFDKD